MTIKEVDLCEYDVRRGLKKLSIFLKEPQEVVYFRLKSAQKRIKRARERIKFLRDHIIRRG